MASRRYFDGAQIEIGSLPIETAAAVQTITLNRLESTAQVYLPTVILAGGTQTITLLRLESTAQVFLPTIQLASAITDTSDILDRGIKKRGLTKKEEEQIAAQLLLERRAKAKPTEEVKRSLDWKKLILDQINGATTEAELDAVNIPSVESVEITAQVLAELERKKEARRIELEIVRREAELKAAELESQLKAHEDAIRAKIESQRAALLAAKQFQIELLARHQIAVDAAIELEQQARLAADEAERKAVEFNRKRDQRIKRLKALMWLSKLDL